MKINKNKFVKSLQNLKKKYHMSLAKIARRCKIPVSKIYKITSPHSHVKPVISSNIAKKIAQGLGFNNQKANTWILKMGIKKSKNNNKNTHNLHSTIKSSRILKYGIHDMMSQNGISKRTLQKRTNIKLNELNRILSGNAKEIPSIFIALIAKALNTNVDVLIRRSKQIASNNRSANHVNISKESNNSSKSKKKPSSKPQIHVNPYIFSIAEQLSKSNSKVIGTAENVIKHLDNPNYQRTVSDLINLNRHDFNIVAPLIMRIYKSERRN